MEPRRDSPWLQAGDGNGIAKFLRERGWIDEGEIVQTCARAGEGNMNLTLRVVTNRRSLVLKQARPWVEKYDHIPAPEDRALFEQKFYARASEIEPVGVRMPRLLRADRATRTLLLEDLPEARDFSSLYRGDRISVDELDELATYLQALHEATYGEDRPDFENREMRSLNHAHIYRIPLDPDNGVRLEQYEPGLSDAAAALRGDARFVQRLAETGERYLSTGPSLVHGDYFPGSWLRTSAGVRIIDPEFCFYGDAEFDLGVAVAHLALAAQPLDAARRLLATYRSGLSKFEIDESWIARFASAEVMRRLVGVAQLPIPASAGTRAALLAASRRTLLQESWEQLWN